MSGFEKRGHFALFVDFGLVVLGGSTVGGLSVALCLTLIAAPTPEICSLKVQKYARCDNEKQSRNYVNICKYGNGVTILSGLKRRKGLWVQTWPGG